MTSFMPKHRNTKILAIVVSLVVVIIVLFFPSEKRSMERVLLEDSTTSMNVSSVDEVVAKMRAININGCPLSFKSAYMRHINAWEDLRDLETKVLAHKEYSTSWNMAFDAFLQGFMGNPFGVVNELSQQDRNLEYQYEEIQQNIKMTYREVESIAIAAGCSLPSR